MWLTFVLIGFHAIGARAQEAPSPHLEFNFTPYLWVSGVTGTTSTRDPAIPSQTATASFGDLLGHLNSIPIIGALEVRYGRVGLLTDLMVISLKSDVQTNGIAFSGGSVRVTELISTILPTYRILEAGDQTLDLGVGARVMTFWTKSASMPEFCRAFRPARPSAGRRRLLACVATWICRGSSG